MDKDTWDKLPDTAKVEWEKLKSERDEYRYACKMMAKTWDSHSAFLTIHNYAHHGGDCRADEIACACGLSQSRAVFRAGMTAIRNALGEYRCQFRYADGSYCLSSGGCGHELTHSPQAAREKVER